MTNNTTKSDADAYRCQQAIALIEALCIVDPETGNQFPAYETDPANANEYRLTKEAHRIREADGANN